VLVTGATGKQGGATARALRAAGVAVRALVRDPGTDRAKAVEALGAELVTGDLHDRDSVIRAAEGARAVFSVQMPGMTTEGFDFDGEVIQGVNLIEGAKAAGVAQFVHTSVTGASRHTDTVTRCRSRTSPDGSSTPTTPAKMYGLWAGGRGRGRRLPVGRLPQCQRSAAAQPVGAVL
jgi:nucleoside-diphosphate-sugar epimerase